MLYKAQNPNLLYIGGILPLNVETMTEVRSAFIWTKSYFCEISDIKADLSRIHNVAEFCLNFIEGRLGNKHKQSINELLTCSCV